MSDMFSMMYDEIFLKDNKANPLNYDEINALTKRYIDSNAKIEDKKMFLRLKREYFKIINIQDYRNVQKKLYGDKSRNDIISFELARIRAKCVADKDIMEQIANVEKTLSAYDEDISEELYLKIIDGIIKLELSLGMRIGLFNELCRLFEEEVELLGKKNLNVRKK